MSLRIKSCASRWTLVKVDRKAFKPIQNYRLIHGKKEKHQSLKEEFSKLTEQIKTNQGIFEKIHHKFENVNPSDQNKGKLAYILAKKIYEECLKLIKDQAIPKAKEGLYHAEKYLQQASGIEASRLRAKVYFELGQRAASKNSYEAVKYFQSALENLPRTKKHIPEMQWEMPLFWIQERSPELLGEISVALGNAAFLEGDLKKAKKYYEKTIDLGVKKSEQVEAWVRLACIACMQKGMEHAVSDFHHALKINHIDAAKLIGDSLFFFLPHYYLRAEITEQSVFLEAPIYDESIIQFLDNLDMYDRFFNTDKEKIKGNFPKIEQVFKTIHETIKDQELRLPLVAEILLKLWAFYDPSKGDCITLPSGDSEQNMMVYKVDEKMTLGLSIPVYGLVSKDVKVSLPPILVFRGTAPALSRQGGIESLLEDIDPLGVARQIYDKSEHAIQGWIKKATRDGAIPARVFGYSQGAALAALTVVRCAQYVSQDPLHPSITFNPPGIDQEALVEWKKVKNTFKNLPIIKQYLVEGDLVSRYGGGLIGDAYEILTPQKYNVLDAHISLALLQHGWRMYKVDIEKDNLFTFRLFATGFIESVYGKAFYQSLKNSAVINFALSINNATSNPRLGNVINYLKKILAKIV